ncbi:MAG: thiamine ABC transporter substrate-binding protein [Actinobacteria bacterium]|nr:thiamine ABC transporter substrate-binding protein [Actinomycetota bacterium]
MKHRPSLAVMVLAAALASACASSNDSTPKRLVLIAYDSFSPPDDAFDLFTEETGIEVEIALGGDAGELIAKAGLTAGNPEGDVLWGVDNTLLSRALEADVFDPYVSKVHPLREDLVASGAGVVTPVDFGDVCINVDDAALDSRDLPSPTSLDDLIDPAYRGLLVVSDASTSSPGLAFLLATIDRYGNDGWADYWRALVANEVLVVSGWSDAYYTAFSRYGGDRPLVLSYASSPPAEVIFADPPLPEGAPAPTSVMIDSCFRQVEFAGVLRGTEYVEQARQLVDYLVSAEFQRTLPESLFVFPANTRAELPSSFVRHAPTVTDPATMAASRIADGRARWVEEWLAIVS